MIHCRIAEVDAVLSADPEASSHACRQDMPSTAHRTSGTGSASAPAPAARPSELVGAPKRQHRPSVTTALNVAGFLNPHAAPSSPARYPRMPAQGFGVAYRSSDRALLRPVCNAVVNHFASHEVQDPDVIV